MAYEAVTVQEPGQPASFEYPTLNPDYSIQFDRMDGHSLGPFVATSISVSSFDLDRERWNRDCYAEEVSVACYLTEARFAFVCKRYDKGGGWIGFSPGSLAFAMAANVVSRARASGRSRGRALTGHLRYPWIHFIGFHWLGGGDVGVPGCDQTLRMTYESDNELAKLELEFKHGPDAAWLAYTLMQRAVAYRLVDSSPKTQDEIRELRELLTGGPAGQPRPGKMAGYNLPKPIDAGAGEEYAPPNPPSALHTPSEGDRQDSDHGHGSGSTPPPAGWYADPQDNNRLRYWTGSQWTEQIWSGSARSTRTDPAGRA